MRAITPREPSPPGRALPSAGSRGPDSGRRAWCNRCRDSAGSSRFGQPPSRPFAAKAPGFRASSPCQAIVGTPGLVHDSLGENAGRLDQAGLVEQRQRLERRIRPTLVDPATLAAGAEQGEAAPRPNDWLAFRVGDLGAHSASSAIRPGSRNRLPGPAAEASIGAGSPRRTTRSARQRRRAAR